MQRLDQNGSYLKVGVGRYKIASRGPSSCKKGVHFRCIGRFSGVMAIVVKTRCL